jgi:hypothetical protein
LHLLRYEWLGPVVVARLALMVAGRLGSAAPAGAGQASRLAAGNLLTLFLGVYLAVLAALPVFLERHAVVLSPVLALLLVLDTSSLLAWFRAQEGGLRRLGFAGLAGVAAAFMLGAWLHAPDLRGRLHEITNRYRGPLDQVVAYAQEGYENPADLVIATNSEGIGLRYYLGCIVIVDTFPTRLAQDFMYQPDLIVPRPSGRSQRQLGQLAVRARYDQEDLPVRNLVANNVPTLSPRDASGSVHLFESAELPEGTPGMPVLERVRSAGQGPRKPPE